GDDLLGPAIGSLACLALDLPDLLRRLAACLLGHLLDEGPPGLVTRHPGRLLELLTDRVDQGGRLGPLRLDLPVAFLEGVLSAGHVGFTSSDRFRLSVSRRLLPR